MPTGKHAPPPRTAPQETRLSSIAAALPRDASETLRRFVRQFYGRVPAPWLAQIEPGHAAALAASSFEFMQEREAGAPKIRIFAPRKAEHGYEGRFTVIELINDDMPFLVDSLSAELTRRGFALRDTFHPIFRLRRDKAGALVELAEDNGKGAGVRAESFIHFELSSLPGAIEPEQLRADLEWVLAHVRAAVEDWRKITARAEECLRGVETAQGSFDEESVREVADFLRWLIDRNFVFMGYAADKERLGILKLNDEPAGRETSPSASLIEIAKSNRRSLVHRPAPLDQIRLKRFDARGKPDGEARFLGLFTSRVYYQSADAIPLVRRNIARVIERSQLDPDSHDGKALKAILEFLPRDELFQMSQDDMLETAMGILALESRPGVRVFARKDAGERFISAMVFVPRERFSTELRRQIQAILEKAWNGVTSSFATQISDAPLARLQLTVKTTPGDIPAFDLARIEAEIAKSAYLWSDLLLEALLTRHGEAQAEKLHRAYAGAFPQSYVNRYGGGDAVLDIARIEEAFASGRLALEFFRARSEPERFVHLKIYNPNEAVALSDIMPLLENAGFRVIEEHPFLIDPQDAPRQARIRDFKLELPEGAEAGFAAAKTLLEEMLLAVWQRETENDRFNALTLLAGLNWRQVTVLRAYARYLRQAGFAHSQAAIEQALGRQPRIASLLMEYFAARFEPGRKDRDAGQQKALAAIEEALSQVAGAAEDRILRRCAELIQATLRTNYYKKHCPILSFKFDSARVPDLPPPRPYAEIFVYGPRVEGIHLRGGKVARGGLRWSDRHEDFRTEVLGLMKAQMVKNSVIVPVGSKGGFVVKRPPEGGGREALLEEGIACYTLFLQGLLDLTDNIAGGQVAPPAQLVRHDGDDPYLVVAADKGTASFSDIANGVSAQYGFWLGDAFASGGSAGYDHKEMGITARGGWISVARHFREMGVDITAQDFTVCGIGDMSGDVFGNGMLLSDRIRLVAAFNHAHIFLDPSPDPKAGFAERKRLFHLPRSSWKDYDAKLISKGGGVFERGAKTIALSKEAQATLGVAKASMTPDELVRAILLAPVDLLWNGGIGTYVKAEDETHEQAGDRANNAVRVNGNQLRCKIVGEGGNLGFTQKGRIEYARAGGRINTDAIDNSAGVDCSDHEVNIKIAFAGEMDGKRLDKAARDTLLADMADEVARLVLKDNQLQTQALTVAQQQGARLLESQERLMQALERRGLLDRAIEFLPGDKQLAEMKAARKGMTRPELAVLLAYGKMALYRDLLESTLPDEPYFTADLMRYFPRPMQEGFKDAIAHHRLRREITATVVTNSLVNRAGITFYSDIAEDTGASARDIAAAYALARDAFGLRALWKDIETSPDAALQAQLLAAAAGFLERCVLWLLRNLPPPLDVERAMGEFAPGIAELAAVSGGAKSATPEARVAELERLSSAFDILSVARQSALPPAQAGDLYFQVGTRLCLDWLRLRAERLAAASHWERLAARALAGDFYDEQRRLTLSVIAASGQDSRSARMGAWEEPRKDALARFDRFVESLKSGETPDLPRLTVALRQVKSL